MQYRFPEGLTLTETRAAIEAANARIGIPAFIEADRGEFVIFNYLVATPLSFPQPWGQSEALNREAAVLRECRGLTFDKASGQVVARKYHKFFNVNEKPETQTGEIDWSTQHHVLEKLDGSMLVPVLGQDGETQWHTKMGRTEVARPVEEFVRNSPLPYNDYARACRNANSTPIFEWCSRQQRIVVDYPEDRLVLTAIRNNFTGAYTPYASLEGIAANWGLPVVAARSGRVDDISEFLRETGDLVGAEGWVIRFADGHHLKTKGSWYLAIHKTKELLQFEKDVWALVLSDKLDDAKAFMDPDDRAAVEAFEQRLYEGIATVAHRLQAYVDQARAAIGDDRRRFATEWVNVPGVDASDRGLLFQIYAGIAPDAAIRRVMTSALLVNGLNVATGSKIEAIRYLADGARWTRGGPALDD